jgi:hypothetical protein
MLAMEIVKMQTVSIETMQEEIAFLQKAKKFFTEQTETNVYYRGNLLAIRDKTSLQSFMFVRTDGAVKDESIIVE